MQATFKLTFTVDFDLIIEWVETGERSVIPHSHWPNNSEEIKHVASAVFPRYQLQVASFHRRAKHKALARERYYKRLVPEQEEFTLVSKSSGKTYKITVIDKGKGRDFHCSCPDYAFRRKQQGQRCKHIAEWLKEKQHPVADEIAVQDEHTTYPIQSLVRKINRTLRTFDCDEFVEQEFARTVRARNLTH